MSVDMKLMIASTFAEMTQHKNVDKITVKDLVEQCGISRQAFYYHFQDILEVMEWSVRQMLQHALQNSLHAETSEKAIEALICVAVEHKDWLNRLLSSQRHVQVERIFVEAMRSSIRQMIYTKKPDLTMNHQDLEVALYFYAYGISGAIFESCQDKEIDSQRLSHQLYRLLSGQMLKI